MFTGIIHRIGSVHDARAIGSGVQLTICEPEIAAELKVDDSISVNGVCLTVVRREMELFTVVAVEETLGKTTLGKTKHNQQVNLELAMKLDDRMGGHLVSGHVDCVGEIQSIELRGVSWLIHVLIPPQYERYVIPEGSIAIDGVSLTVASVEGNILAVSIIPHTMENTIFGSYGLKSAVNIEFDMIGKYVEKLLGATAESLSEDPISRELMTKWGYNL